jgi:hypothetical protein
MKKLASLLEELEIISEAESKLDANNWQCFVTQIFWSPAKSDLHAF